MSHFIVVWGRDLETPKARPYSTYTAKDGRPLAFSDDNLWFDDCPTASDRQELDNILAQDSGQQVVIPLNDVPDILGWDDIVIADESSI